MSLIDEIGGIHDAIAGAGEAKPMKQIRVTKCGCNSELNGNPCKTCYGVWRDFIEDEYQLFKIDGGCVIHKNNIEKYDTRDAPDSTGEEVSEVRLYHIVAWNKDDEGKRGALIWHGHKVAKSVANAQVKAMVEVKELAEWDVDDIDWQVVEVD